MIISAVTSPVCSFEDVGIDEWLDLRGPTLEEVEEIFQEEDSQLLKDIIDDELQELDDIINQLDEKDLEEIIEELEEEQPEEEEGETNEHEQEEKECRTITLTFGNVTNTFNTCDEDGESGEGGNGGTGGGGGHGDNPPPSPSTAQFWCPVYDEQRSWSNTGYFYWYQTSWSYFEDYKVKKSKIDWVADSRKDYRDWVKKLLEEGTLRKHPDYRKYIKVEKSSGGSNTLPETGYIKLVDYHEVAGKKVTVYLRADAYSGSTRRTVYPYPFAHGVTNISDCIGSTSPIPKPPTDDSTRNPETVVTRKPRGNRMKEDCCKATLSLTRKIALNVGAIASSGEIYPPNTTRVRTREDYGFPIRVPRKWLFYNARDSERMTIYNHKQLNIILLAKLAESNQVLGVSKILTESFPIATKLTIPGAPGDDLTYDYPEILSKLFAALILTGTYLELREQLLTEMTTSSIEVGEVFEGGWFGGRRGQPEIIFTFWEHKQDVAETFDQVRGRITIRIMDKTDDPDSNLPKITWADIRQLQQKIYQIFVLPSEGKGFVWKKGKEIVNYTDRKAGYSNNILCRNKEEGKRVMKALLAVQDKFIDITKLRPGAAYDPAQTYPTIPPRKTVLGEQRRMPRQRPIADVRFCPAVLLMQFYPGPIVLINNRQIVALPDD